MTLSPLYRYGRIRGARIFYQLLDRQGISDDIYLSNRTLREWGNYYHYHRPHGALAGQTAYDGFLQRLELRCHQGP